MGREKEGERVYGLWFGAAQTIQPEERVGEGEVSGRWAVRGGEDGDGLGAPAEEAARVVGGEAVLQVKIGGEALQPPAGELARQHLAERLAKVMAYSLAVGGGRGWAGGVVKQGGGAAFRKAFDGEAEAPASFRRGLDDAALDVSLFVPKGEKRGGAMAREIVVPRLDRERKLPGLLIDGLLCGGEE